MDSLKSRFDPFELLKGFWLH